MLDLKPGGGVTGRRKTETEGRIFPLWRSYPGRRLSFPRGRRSLPGHSPVSSSFSLWRLDGQQRYSGGRLNPG